MDGDSTLSCCGEGIYTSEYLIQETGREEAFFVVSSGRFQWPKWLNSQWPSIRARKERGVVIALLAVHVSAMLYQAAHDSPTWDEVGHFAAGLYYWKDGHFDLYCVNPPLPRLLGGTSGPPLSAQTRPRAPQSGPPQTQ